MVREIHGHLAELYGKHDQVVHYRHVIHPLQRKPTVGVVKKAIDGGERHGGIWEDRWCSALADAGEVIALITANQPFGEWNRIPSSK